MSTGSMTGADAPALRALAAQLSQSATTLDAIRQGIRSRIYSVQWDGPDGATFRRMWDGQHVPLLSAVAQGLRTTAQTLLAEANQQEIASGVGGGGATVGPGGGPTIGPATGGFVPADDEDGFLADLEDMVKATSLLVGGFGALYGGLADNLATNVGGHFRNGTWIDDYTRWNAGWATRLNGLFGSAGDVARTAEDLARVGRVLPYVGGAFNAYDQWQEDSEYSTGERTARAAGAGLASVAADAGTEWAMMGAGAAIGTAIFPGVGTVIGGALGWAAAAGITHVFEDQITAAGAWLGSAAWNIGEGVVDFGGDLLEAGGDLLEAGGDLAEDLGDGAEAVWDTVSFWN